MNQVAYYFYVLFVPMRIKHIVFIICFLFSLQALAQQVSPRAQTLYNKAMQYRVKKENEKAFETMREAIKEYSGYTDAYSALGEWYFKAHRFNDAVKIFTSASSSCANCAKSFAKPLAKSLLHNNQPVEALQLIQSHSTDKDNGEWLRMKEQAIFLRQIQGKPIKDTPSYMGSSINSKYAEMYPSMAADTSTIYFTRALNGIDQDFYSSTIDSCGGWFYARNMGSPPNTSDQESAQMISGDGHYIFFSRCENRSVNGWDRGGCDLYMAYTADSVWSVPQSFGATINTPAYEGMPCLSADNRELYFVSDRPGGYGGMDIWVSQFDNGLWQQPHNMGPEINTAGNETAPFIHIDNNTLYFASDGHPGMGGIDLFISRRITDTIWSKAENMGRPFNSSSDDNSICLTYDGKKSFFASDRDSAAGDFNLYEMKLPKNLQPIPITMVKGYSYDSLTKEKLNYTSIYINDISTGKELYHFVSNRGDASFMITLPAGKDYLYDADRIGYMRNKDTIHIPKELASKTTECNIPLLPQDYVAPINDSLVITITFARNASQLSDSDRVNLAKALDPWILDKNIILLINGYTDNTGTPMINEQLSIKRASLVTEAVTTMGIDPCMIQSQGWGEANPRFPNDNEENQSRNRRVEVIIRR